MGRQILSSPSYPQQLENLRIPYEFEDRTETPEGDDTNHHFSRKGEAGWNVFEELLLSDRFSSLRTVHFAAQN